MIDLKSLTNKKATLDFAMKYHESAKVLFKEYEDLLSTNELGLKPVFKTWDSLDEVQRKCSIVIAEEFLNDHIVIPRQKFDELQAELIKLKHQLINDIGDIENKAQSLMIDINKKVIG